MRKVICSMLAVLLLLPVFATTALAHGHGGQRHTARQHCVAQQPCAPRNDCVTNGNCTDKCRFVDENGDNVCDNCKNQCAGCGETRDDNADGICDQCGKCSHYADENEDGLCDYQADCENRKNAVCKSAQTKSTHHGRRHRNHH